VLGRQPGVNVTIESPDTIILHGLAPLPIGQAAAEHGWVILELSPIISSLEDAYLNLTDSAVEYRSTTLV
jgi:ABC-2 type transport system ATP-binding protein